ncbi:hypothetical protein [Tunicatimonas pelagia]|uniref:hypothetical protein n=1 Tax=Tunicatimonas pelagia TaxID=931531 RepID=UPI0026658D76|nr:hypothetical protein [Tunicatimonas pelagia]WKN40467.1 hypothetical protein P0M28_15590 [Tunicatimonas pelagia]
MKTLVSFSLTSVLFVALLWLTSCASSKTMTYDPAGTWNYTVTGTPSGTVDGTMVISKNGDSYTGEMQSALGNAALDNLKIEDNALNASLYFQGTELNVTGTFEGNTFDGEVVAGYDSFGMTASRSN